MTTLGAAGGTTVGQLVAEVVRVLDAGGVPEPLSESRDLVSALCDVPRFWPVRHSADVIDAAVRHRALRAAESRARGAPLAYAVGRATFRHVTLHVDERVLIPRPETEQLVELVLAETAGMEGAIVVDVATGSGAIAVSLASEGGGRFARVYGTDISRDAVDVARGNVDMLADSLCCPVEIVQGSLLSPLPDVRPQVVVSNPPYIAIGEAGSLPASVRDWEPAAALYSGSDGLDATRQLVRQAAAALAPGGVFAIEVDARRASLAAELVSAERAFRSIRVLLDLTGRERFVLARRHDEEDRK